MGAGASTERLLPAQDALKISKQYKLRIAEVVYCYRRYIRVKAMLSTKLNKLRSRTKTVQGQVTTNEGEASEISASTANLNTSDVEFKSDRHFILDRIFSVMFDVDIHDPSSVEKISFDLFVEKMLDWRSYRTDDKLMFFFKVMDFDGDDLIGIEDITAFLLHVTKYKFKVGDRVKIRNDDRKGVLKYLGLTKFQPGIWAGIELDSPSKSKLYHRSDAYSLPRDTLHVAGKNNGTVDRVKYFETQPNYGIFIEQRFLELESHYNMASEMLYRFSPKGATESLNFDLFRSRLMVEPWISEKLFFDPLPFKLSGKTDKFGGRVSTANNLNRSNPMLSGGLSLPALNE